MPSVRTCPANEPTVSLRDARQQLNLSQMALAMRLGVTQPQVAQLEAQADMHLSTLQRYVAALGGDLAVIARFPERQLEIALPAQFQTSLNRPTNQQPSGSLQCITKQQCHAAES